MQDRAKQAEENRKNRPRTSELLDMHRKLFTDAKLIYTEEFKPLGNPHKTRIIGRGVYGCAIAEEVISTTEKPKC